MKHRILKMGLCFSLVLTILSGCAGKAEQPHEDPEPKNEKKNDVLDEEKTSRKDSAPSNVTTGDTPEEIIELFFDALEEQDVDTMFSCFYLDEMVDRYSFPYSVERAGTFSPYNWVFYPVNSQFYRELMLSERKADYAKSIRFFTWSILLAEDEEWSDGSNYSRAIPGLDYDWAEEFEDKVDVGQIRRIKIISIDENNPEMQQSDAFHNKWSKQQCRVYGVDKICERTVLFKCNGNLFYKGFTLVQYDDQWQISNLSAAILGDSVLGTATLIETEDDYWDAIE